jgi:hypothetical protein
MSENNQEARFCLHIAGAKAEDLEAISKFIQERGLRLENVLLDEHKATPNCATPPSSYFAFDRQWHRQEASKQFQVFRSDLGDELVLIAYQEPRINNHNLSCSPSPNSDFKGFIESLKLNCSCQLSELKAHLMPLPVEHFH